jgi:hypothetical protein
MSTVKPHQWTLAADFEMHSAWRPGQRVRHEWSKLGLNLEQDDDVTKITIPKDTSTNLGSVPRSLWWFCSPVDIAMASVVHDEMYRLIASAKLNVHDRMLRRSEADDVFLIGMQIQKDSWNLRSFAAWLSVRLFGWLFAYGIISGV